MRRTRTADAHVVRGKRPKKKAFGPPASAASLAEVAVAVAPPAQGSPGYGRARSAPPERITAAAADDDDDPFLARLAIAEKADEARRARSLSPPPAAPSGAKSPRPASYPRPPRPAASSRADAATRQGLPRARPKASSSRPPTTAPPPLTTTRSHSRLYAAFRLATRTDRTQLSSAPSTATATPPSTPKWSVARRFVDWLLAERARRRQKARSKMEALTKRVMRSQRQAKARRAHTARRDAEWEAQLGEAERLRRDHARASHEEYVLSTLLAGGAAGGASAEADAQSAPALGWSQQAASAAAAAATAQEARVEAANALPSPVRKLRPGDDLWSQHGGPAIEVRPTVTEPAQRRTPTPHVSIF